MAKDYAAPLADMDFLLQTQTSQGLHHALPLLSQAASFLEKEWAPIKALGDAQGCSFDQGQVTLAAQTKAAWRRYVDGGWIGITLPEQWAARNCQPPSAHLWGRCSTVPTPL